MKFLDLCKSKMLFKGALFSAIFFSLLFATLVFAPGAKAGPNSPTFNNDDNGTECAWISDANINCGDVEYWFDLDLTVSKGRAMYHARFEDNWQPGYIIFEDDGTTGQIVNSPDVTTDGTDATILDREKRDLRRYAENDNPDTPRDNGELRGFTGPFVPGGDTGEQYFFCGLESGANQKCWSGRGGVEKTVSADAATLLERLRDDITATIDSDENCTQDSGALGFVLCPMLRGIQNAIDALIGTDGSSQGFIVELLTIKPLDQNTTPELYRGWEAVRNIALALYVLIFAIIIFGNGVGYDPYTIKRALPRLAAGVVLTFASFFIMQTVIDVSNFLGNMVPAFVNWMSEGTAVTTFNFDVNFAYQGISIILIIVFAVVALGALLVGLAGLITRVVIIYGLVLLAPLAFLAWVLPNTEGMFKKWWKNLIKVAMMFPIVTGMLSLSIFFAKIMSQTASSTNNGVLAIAASLAPLIAIILIPKTFKWGGEAFAAAAGYVAGKAMSAKDTGKGLAASGMKAGGKGIMASEKAQDIATGLASNKVARRLGGAAFLRKAQGAKAERLGAGGKLVENMSNEQLKKVATNGNFQERVAASKALMEKGEGKFVGGLMRGEGGKGAASSARYAHERYKRDAKGAGANLIAYTDGKFDAGKTKENIRNMSTDSMITDLGDAAMEEIVKEGKLMGHDLKEPGGGRSLLSRQIDEARGSATLYGKATEAKQKIIGPGTFAGAAGAAAGGTSGGTGGGTAGGGPRTSGGPSGTGRPSGSPSGTTRPSGGGTPPPGPGGSTPPPGPTTGGPTPHSPWGPGGLGGPGGGASPAPTTPPPTGGPAYYGTGSGPVPSGGTGGPGRGTSPVGGRAEVLDRIPSSRRELIRYEKENYGTNPSAARDELPEFVQRTLSAIVAEKPAGARYAGTVASVMGNADNPSNIALKEVVSQKAGREVSWDEYLKMDFHEVAGHAGVDVQAVVPDYNSHFRVQAPTTPTPTPAPSISGGSPWSPPPAAPGPSLPPMPAAPSAPAPSTGGGSIPPATPVSVSGGTSTPIPVSAPIPARPSGGISTTTIVNNNSVNQVFQQSGSLRSQMSGGGLEGYGDLMRKMDSIDAKLASGRVDTASLKKDLKTLRLARESAPESIHSQIDDYMRSAERAAGIPENAGAHDDVDVSGG